MRRNFWWLVSLFDILTNMGINLKTTDDPKDAANFIAKSILLQLQSNKRVLWLVAGGSCILVAIEVAKLISEHPHKNLVVMLMDERYGVVGHPDSNWYQLLKDGLKLPEAKLI